VYFVGVDKAVESNFWR